MYAKENMWTSPFFFEISAFFFVRKRQSHKFVSDWHKPPLAVPLPVEVQSNAAAPAANEGTLPTR
jgi:hypothetical protein